MFRWCADVYERLTPKGKKATFKTLLLTQLVSGVWHGLFAGYGLFFATSAFMFESAKVCAFSPYPPHDETCLIFASAADTLTKMFIAYLSVSMVTRGND
jgi:hypothetical protein